MDGADTLAPSRKTGVFQAQNKHHETGRRLDDVKAQGFGLTTSEVFPQPIDGRVVNSPEKTIGCVQVPGFTIA
jgi:hypothetical protein